MNLQEQIDLLQARIDQLISHVSDGAVAMPASAPSAAPPALKVARPSQNEISLAIGEHAVTLTPADVSALIETLGQARASMQPEPPTALPEGWRFVATQDPVMASQPRGGGETLLVLRHTGYGWVPFVFSAPMIVELIALLTGQPGRK